MEYQKTIGQDILIFQNERMHNNTYCIILGDTLLIVDPSWNAQKLIGYFKDKNINKIIIFLTHGHFDHLGDLKLLLDVWKNFDIYINEKEKYLLFSNELNKNWPFQINLLSCKSNVKFYDFKNEFIINNNHFNFIETPGHSVGSTTISYKNYFFTGDFIFLNEIGRTDLLSSCDEQMVHSIKKINDLLKDDDFILPGHNEQGLFKELLLQNNEYQEYLKK